MPKRLVFIVCFCSCWLRPFAQDIYELKNGNIQFSSIAPKEFIRASSVNLKGVVDFQKKTFVFKIRVSSFIGFNSPMQKEHFNESYLETEQYPDAVFWGKIIEDIDIHKDGDYAIRAKGKLTIHGIEQDRIIPVQVKVKNEKMQIRADFIISLADHSIKVPRVVNDKLAADINVMVTGTLTRRL